MRNEPRSFLVEYGRTLVDNAKRAETIGPPTLTPCHLPSRVPLDLEIRHFRIFPADFFDSRDVKMRIPRLLVYAHLQNRRIFQADSLRIQTEFLRISRPTTFADNCRISRRQISPDSFPNIVSTRCLLKESRQKALRG